jgi:hypothetical protein
LAEFEAVEVLADDEVGPDAFQLIWTLLPEGHG